MIYRWQLLTGSKCPRFLVMTGRIFSQPPLISFKRDKNIGNVSVRIAFQTSNQPGTFKCAHARCQTCPFICNVEKFSGPKRSIKNTDHFTCTSANVIYCITCTLCKKLYTVEPRYNEPRYSEDPVTTNNIWKPGRITVKCMETNPAITNLILTVPTHNLPRYNEYFVLSLSVSKKDMMIQMADKPNTTRIGQDGETLTFKALLYLNVAVMRKSVDCSEWCISHSSAWFSLVAPL